MLDRSKLKNKDASARSKGRREEEKRKHDELDSKGPCSSPALPSSKSEEVQEVVKKRVVPRSFSCTSLQKLAEKRTGQHER